MKYLSLVLLLAAGCSRPLVEATDTLDVVFTTDRQAYTLQDRIGLSVENKMPDPILVRQCFELEQRKDEQWVFVGHGGRCQGTFQRVQVGGRPGWGFSSFEAEHPAGTYRFVVMVLLQEDWKQQEQVATDAFTIKR